MSNTSLTTGNDGRFYAPDGRKFVYQNPMVLRGYGKTNTDVNTMNHTSPASFNIARKHPPRSYKPPKKGEKTVTEVVPEPIRSPQQEQKGQDSKVTSALGYIAAPVKLFGSMFSRSEKKTDKKKPKRPPSSSLLKPPNEIEPHTVPCEPEDYKKQATKTDECDSMISEPTVIQSMGDFEPPKKKLRPVANSYTESDNWKLVNSRKPKVKVQPRRPKSQSPIAMIRREAGTSVELIKQSEQQNGMTVTKKDKTNTASFRIQSAEGIAKETKLLEKERIKSSKQSKGNRYSRHPMAYVPPKEMERPKNIWKRTENAPKPIPLKMTINNLRPEVKGSPRESSSKESPNDEYENSQMDRSNSNYCSTSPVRVKEINEVSPIKKDIGKVINQRKSKKETYEPQKRESNANDSQTQPQRRTNQNTHVDNADANAAYRSRTSQETSQSIPKTGTTQKTQVDDSNGTYRSKTSQETQAISKLRTTQKPQVDAAVVCDVIYQPKTFNDTQRVSRLSPKGNCDMEDQYKEIQNNTDNPNTMEGDPQNYKVNTEYNPQSFGYESYVDYSNGDDGTNEPDDEYEPVTESCGIIDNLFKLFSPKVINPPPKELPDNTIIKPPPSNSKKRAKAATKTPNVTVESLINAKENLEIHSTNTYINSVKTKEAVSRPNAPLKNVDDKMVQLLDPYNLTEKQKNEKKSNPQTKKENIGKISKESLQFEQNKTKKKKKIDREFKSKKTEQLPTVDTPVDHKVRPPIQEHKKNSVNTKVTDEVKAPKQEKPESSSDTTMQDNALDKIINSKTKSQITEEKKTQEKKDTTLNTDKNHTSLNAKQNESKSIHSPEKVILNSEDNQPSDLEIKPPLKEHNAANAADMVLIKEIIKQKSPAPFKANDEILKQEKDLNVDIYKDFSTCIEDMTDNIETLIETNKQLLTSDEDVQTTEADAYLPEVMEDNDQSYANTPPPIEDDHLVRVPLVGKPQARASKRDTKWKANMLAPRTAEHSLGNKWAASHKPSLIYGELPQRTMTRQQALAFGNSISVPKAVDSQHLSMKMTPSIIGTAGHRFYFSNCGGNNGILAHSQENQISVNSMYVRDINQLLDTKNCVTTLNDSGDNYMHMATILTSNDMSHLFGNEVELDVCETKPDMSSYKRSAQPMHYKNKCAIQSAPKLTSIQDLKHSSTNQLTQSLTPSKKIKKKLKSRNAKNNQSFPHTETSNNTSKLSTEAKSVDIESTGSSFYEILKNLCLAESSSERGEVP